MKRHIIGLDVGGTKISLIIATDAGRILVKTVIPTEVERGPEHTIKKIIAEIKGLLKEVKIKLQEVKGIGIGVPGSLDPIKGTILGSPNMPGWSGISLKDILNSEFGLPVILDNDANTAALGEKLFGAGRDIDSLFYFTVSTGIGGGFIINGKIHHGASFNAAEVGHMVILPDGPKCNCGKRGCLEALASGTAVARSAREKVKNNPSSLIMKLVDNDVELITARIVAEAAKEGDELAKQIYQEAGTFLGIGVANVLNLINPQMVVIGGGLSYSGSILFEPMRERARQEAFGRTYQVCQIVPSKLGNTAGCLGAVGLVL